MAREPAQRAAVVDPAAAAAGAGSWTELAERVQGCVVCAELVASRNSVVPGAAPPSAEVLLIGEAPGAQEDDAGVPFVGKSGQLLDGLLAEAGLDRHKVAITNVVKCRPPANRKPRRGEVARCRPWLIRQIALLDPRVVVALGGTAAEWFFGPSARIVALREQVQRYDGRPLVVTYHPSAAIRFGPKGLPLEALRRDLRAVADLVGAPPVILSVATAQEMRDLGARLARLLRAGDLLVLTGDLGAGKTTLTQGLAEALGVRGPVTSPTFVIARVHPHVYGEGPALVHVDAYRLADIAEVDDLDLDASLQESVTVVEWGAGLVEGLSDDHLVVDLHRSAELGDEARTVTVRAVGDRWSPVDLGVALG